MDAEQLQRLRELASEATPGPWTGTEGCAVFADGLSLIADTFCSATDHPNGITVFMPWSQPQCAANAAFIAAACPATVIALLDRIAILERDPSDARFEAENLRAARDEACRIAREYIPERAEHPVHEEDRARISALLQVGR